MSTTTTQVSWFHRTFPGLSLFTKYRRRWLRGDVLAGITVAAYLVPQVMAYATIAGLPPVTGLWTIIPVIRAVVDSGPIDSWRDEPSRP